MIKILILSLSFLGLTSCSLLFSRPTQPIQQYILLDTHSTNGTSNPVVQRKSLGFNPIQTPIWLNTPKMAYQLKPDTLNYFALNQWLAPPPQLLQPLVLQALSKANLYRAIVTLPSATQVDQVLTLNLLQMQQQFWQPTSQYQLTIQATLTHGNRFIATQNFTLTVAANAATPEAGVIAANQSITQWLPQLIAFCRAHVT